MGSEQRGLNITSQMRPEHLLFEQRQAGGPVGVLESAFPTPLIDDGNDQVEEALPGIAGLLQSVEQAQQDGGSEKLLARACDCNPACAEMPLLRERVSSVDFRPVAWKVPVIPLVLFTGGRTSHRSPNREGRSRNAATRSGEVDFSAAGGGWRV